MRRSAFILCLILAALGTACNPVVTEIPQDTADATPTPQSVTTDSFEPMTLPFSEPGPYDVGQRKFNFTDPARDDREVPITLWYPAKRPFGSEGGKIIRDAKPDLKEAPYPLILSSTKVAGIFAPYLVSHGFTWVSVDGIDSYMAFYQGAIDQPLDILFALDQMGDNPPEGLEGLIDANNAGTIGYSFDGFNSLAMSGARIDPEYYLAQCPTPDAITEAILGGLSAFSCAPAGKWDEFTAHVGESITVSEDGLWQPLTDPRIRAVMPMAGEGWWLFGEKGLAAVNRPTLIIVSTEDELYPENVLIFEHLGTADKTLISFIGQNHMMIYDEEMVARMAHFVTAFFGYHLQGRQDLAQYFSEEFVSQYDDLAWGEYTEE
jgi:predicted dienelactone hydrolase